MKRVIALFFSLFLLFLFVVVVRAESRTSGGAGNFTIDERTSLQIKAMVCAAYPNEIVEKVVHGRLITAFELCRKQGGGVEECIEKIRKIQEDWRRRCGKDSGYVIGFLYRQILEVVRDFESRLKATADPRRYMDLDPIARMAYFESINKHFAQLFPGSQFSFQTGTGKVVFGGGELYFQGWRWVQYNVWHDSGVLIQVFPKRINWTLERYNISIYLELEPEPRWELLDFNLPFDIQSEKILLALGEGVRVSEKEIIRLADIFLHDTVWGWDLSWIFPSLLTQSSVRENVLKAMVEYFTFDNYIAKVRAEEKRRSKPAEPQPTERKTGPKPKKK